MKTFRLTVLSTLLVSCAFASERSVSDRVLWLEPTEMIPQFVPRGAFSDPRAYGLSVGAVEDVKRDISARLEAFDLRYSAPFEIKPRCFTTPIGGLASSAELRTASISASEVVAVGSVIGSTPGWNVQAGYPTTVVAVRLGDVIASPQLFTAREVSFEVHEGTLIVDDRSICTENPDGDVPIVGQKILIAGVRDDANLSHLQLRVRPVPVINGNVVFGDLDSMSISEIKKVVSEGK